MKPKMAEQRKEECVAKILEGIIAVTIGIGAIVCTAGTEGSLTGKRTYKKGEKNR